MANRLSLSRRLSTAVRWPFGITLTSWRYMWRTTPARRLELPPAEMDERPPPLPEDFELDGVQVPADGVGPLFHRLYRVRVEGSKLWTEELMERMTSDLDAFAPSEFASFQKLDERTEMKAGDEYVVRMPGPWDGPVRVIEITPSSFRLATLKGHLEAGQIEFRAARAGDKLVFTIESWARSGDKLSNLLYHHLRMAKEVQLHMWTSVLERVVRISGGRRSGLVEIETRRVDGWKGE